MMKSAAAMEALGRIILSATRSKWKFRNTATRNVRRANLRWKGSVGGRRVYILHCRRAKKLVPVGIEPTFEGAGKVGRGGDA